MNPANLPSPELMAWCIGIGFVTALLIMLLALLIGETTEERQHRAAHDADAQARAHVRTVLHRLADHRARR